MCVCFLFGFNWSQNLTNVTNQLDVVTNEQEHIGYIGGMSKGGGAGERVR